MPTLDQIRTAGEAKVERILADSDAEARRILKAALKQYGRVQDIPESVWQEIRDHYADNDRLAAAIILLYVAADDWTTQEIGKQGVGVTSDVPMADYALRAAKQTQSLAGTVDTLRDRLARKIEDSRLTGPGAIGDLADNGINQALDDVFKAERIETIATDQTTAAMSAGQIGARDRAAGTDGAATNVDGQRVTIALVWSTESDYLVCPRCAPLEGQPEEIWSLVFPEGPGDDAHPNCRCSLEPQVIVASEDSE